MDEVNNPDVQAEVKDEKSISSDLIRGHINTIILRALYDGDKYGYEIMSEIERKSHGQYSLKEPSLYSALKRLEKSGYVTSYWGGSVAGGRRKYFSLTDEGKIVSEQNQSEWEYSRTVIDSLISDKDFDFNNPAPTAVNMRMLKSSTSRVPSREGENDELEYEPVFDDTLDRNRLNEEFEQKNAALEEERRALEEEKLRLEEELKTRSEEERRALEEEKLRLEEELKTRSEEERRVFEEEKLRLEEELKTRSEEERRALEEEKLRFEEEFKARNEAIDSEREWREHELAARETALALEREQIEAMRSEQLLLANAEQEEKAAAIAAENALIEERKRALDAEEAARRAALDAEESERRRILSEEEAERKRIFEEVEAVRRSAYEAEEAAKKAALASDSEHLRLREQQLNERESMYNEERIRFNELLRQRDELIEAERRNHAEELAKQERRILQEQEALFRQREQQLIHRNFLDLVNSPAQSLPESGAYYAPAPIAPAAPQEPESAPQEYRSVVQRIYAGAVQTERAPEPAPRARSLDGIDFHDLESRASHDGIRVTTTGGQIPAKAQEDVTGTVHKGKALFLSALVFLFVCLVEGAIAIAVHDQYGIPLVLPYSIFAIGFIVALVMGLMWANHYGKRSIRRNSRRSLINGAVLFALCVIITFIVALFVKIDWTNTSSLATFIVVPVIFFFGIVIFGFSYYLQIRPRKKDK